MELMWFLMLIVGLAGGLVTGDKTFTIGNKHITYSEISSGPARFNYSRDVCKGAIATISNTEDIKRLQNLIPSGEMGAIWVVVKDPDSTVIVPTQSPSMKCNILYRTGGLNVTDCNKGQKYICQTVTTIAQSTTNPPTSTIPSTVMVTSSSNTPKTAGTSRPSSTPLPTDDEGPLQGLILGLETHIFLLILVGAFGLLALLAIMCTVCVCCFFKRKKAQASDRADLTALESCQKHDKSESGKTNDIELEKSRYNAKPAVFPKEGLYDEDEYSYVAPINRVPDFDPNKKSVEVSPVPDLVYSQSQGFGYDPEVDTSCIYAEPDKSKKKKNKKAKKESNVEVVENEVYEP